MTPHDFAEWRGRFFKTRVKAALALGLGVTAVAQYETGLRRGRRTAVFIPYHIGLACAAIAMGLPAYKSSNKEGRRDAPYRQIS